VRARAGAWPPRARWLDQRPGSTGSPRRLHPCRVRRSAASLPCPAFRWRRVAPTRGRPPGVASGAHAPIHKDARGVGQVRADTAVLSIAAWSGRVPPGCGATATLQPWRHVLPVSCCTDGSSPSRPFGADPQRAQAAGTSSAAVRRDAKHITMRDHRTAELSVCGAVVRVGRKHGPVAAAFRCASGVRQPRAAGTCAASYPCASSPDGSRSVCCSRATSRGATKLARALARLQGLVRLSSKQQLCAAPGGQIFLTCGQWERQLLSIT
jgi:hypothetical protein